MLTKSASMSALSSLVSPQDWKATDGYTDGRHLVKKKSLSRSLVSQQARKVPVPESLPSLNRPRSSKNNFEVDYDSVSYPVIRRAQSETDLQSLTRGGLSGRLVADGVKASITEGSHMSNGTCGIADRSYGITGVMAHPSCSFIGFEGDLACTQLRGSRAPRTHSFSSVSRRDAEIEIGDENGSSNLSLAKSLAFFSPSSPFSISLSYNGNFVSSTPTAFVLASSPKDSQVLADSVYPFDPSLHVDSMTLKNGQLLGHEAKSVTSQSTPALGFPRSTSASDPSVTSHPEVSDMSSSPSSHCDSPSSTSACPDKSSCDVPSCSCNTSHCFSSSAVVNPGSSSSLLSEPFAYNSRTGRREKGEGVNSYGDDWHGSIQQLGSGMGGGITGGKGGKGGKGLGGSQDWEESSSGNTNSSGADAYYRRALENDPAHPLLLRNYARFLFEVQRDLPRAEEYYERAILAANPPDGEVLAQYAKLIWEAHKDCERAGSYFEQAIQAAPADCYVLAAYASFLWSSDSSSDDLLSDSTKAEQRC